MAFGLGSFLEGLVGKDNVDSARKVYDRTADGLGRFSDTITTTADEVAQYAAEKAKELEAYRQDNLGKRERGEAWYDSERPEEGPMTQYEALVMEDRPLEDQSLVMAGVVAMPKGLGKFGSAYDDLVNAKRTLVSPTRGAVPANVEAEAVLANKLSQPIPGQRMAAGDAAAAFTERDLIAQANAQRGADQMKAKYIMEQRAKDSANTFYN